jgi:hypothetical protein
MRAINKNKREAKAWLGLLFACHCCFVSPPALAEDALSKISEKERQDRPENLAGDAPRVQDYDEIVSPDLTHAASYGERARVALRNGNVSRALSLCKQAMKADDDDPDIHLYYASALEAKLERQTEKDPDIFKECVHEWLKVYRNEVGEERGDTFHGLAVVGTFWNDENRGIIARKHLIKLVGYAPKPWQTDNRFMAKATRPAAVQVTGSVKDESGAKLREKP